MIYVFKDNVLLRSIDTQMYVEQLNDIQRKHFPTDCFAYDSLENQWYVKRTRKYLRNLPKGMVPKELLTCLLLLGVSWCVGIS